MSKIDYVFGKSECIGAWLHNFKIVENYFEGTKERCEICKEIVFFPIFEGRTDNMEYLSYHARQALPPFHKYYYHEYKYINTL